MLCQTVKDGIPKGEKQHLPFRRAVTEPLGVISKGNYLGLHCRSLPSDFDFASQLKIKIGGLPMKMGKPVNCIECGVCSSCCPGRIDVKMFIRELAMMQSCGRLISLSYVRKKELVG